MSTANGSLRRGQSTQAVSIRTIPPTVMSERLNRLMCGYSEINDPGTGSVSGSSLGLNSSSCLGLHLDLKWCSRLGSILK